MKEGAAVRAKLIYHMLPQPDWQAQTPDTEYRPPSLQHEGFIHCTGELDRLVAVANQFYCDIASPFVILIIDETRVQSDVRWEAADGHIFPHIYGPLNLDAVLDVLPFPRADDGRFLPLSTQDT